MRRERCLHVYGQFGTYMNRRKESRQERYENLQDVTRNVAVKIKKGIIENGGFPKEPRGSWDNQFRAPVCDKTEPAFEVMRTHAVVRRGKLFSPKGSLIGQVVKRFVHHLDIFEEGAPKRQKLPVITKNHKKLMTEQTGLEVGEKNVLVPYVEGNEVKVFFGEQQGRHVFVLRPAAGNFQKIFGQWYRELTKK